MKHTLSLDPTPPASTASSAVAAPSRLLDRITIAAIVLVVVLVSIPRLRGFALRENELDAIRTLRILASQPAPVGLAAGETGLAGLVAHDSSLRRRLDDLEIMSDGRLRRHGYLFDMTRMRPGEPMLRAWPWNHGVTGRGAFVWTPERGLLGVTNEGGRFSGAEGAPGPADIGGDWLSLGPRP